MYMSSQTRYQIDTFQTRATEPRERTYRHIQGSLAVAKRRANEPWKSHRDTQNHTKAASKRLARHLKTQLPKAGFPKNQTTSKTSSQSFTSTLSYMIIWPLVEKEKTLPGPQVWEDVSFYPLLPIAQGGRQAERHRTTGSAPGARWVGRAADVGGSKSCWVGWGRLLPQGLTASNSFCLVGFPSKND